MELCPKVPLLHRIRTLVPHSDTGHTANTLRTFPTSGVSQALAEAAHGGRVEAELAPPG